MQKIETVSPAVIKKFRQELAALITTHVSQYGLSASFVGNGQYTTKSFTLKLEVKAEGVSNIQEQYGLMYGVAIGTEFTWSGLNFKVADYAPRRDKPIICEANNGKRYLFTPDDIKRIAVKKPS